jgi:hypothetical protein
MNNLLQALADFADAVKAADEFVQQQKANAIAAIKCYFIEESPLGIVGAALLGCDVF